VYNSIEEQHNARISPHPTLLSIVQTNAMQISPHHQHSPTTSFPASTNGGGAGVFQIASRFNHSCVPNAHFSWNERLGGGEGRMTVHVVKDVKEGEEITLSYCDPYYDPALRGWELQHYGFVCDCAACGDSGVEESFAAGSLQRRARLREIEEDVLSREGGLVSEEENGDGDGVAERKVRPEGLLETVRLCREEGLVNPGLAET